MEQIVKIDGMKCTGCTQKVQDRFEKLAGVQSVQMDLAQKQATLTVTEPVASTTLAAALQDTKYTIA
ncbi:putative copper-chaperone/transport protein [Latilactobacillus fuchuensis]|jgi:copper chaperone CopZ|uniref:Copper-chaperone/transport protein n=2 Tax=Latilactobacillus fuchuensis TaxID=164393 RepID=A0A2N9DWT9_9LACO|nr:heavy metal-associated domain-containing protein [Latilactobacillus fuchuensis]KRL61387.1 hypothetical protein FC69_GL000792 [Latilactobacillus fuchuensis DSM 14340 = JCM 11249]MCP8858297.1 heavy-metal-associated domain-containing protein [Latilactobacillus fuchuensis]SPC39138.1 putative copper-chaperone/transport protein [Latilactobacillus fuchuensis]